MKFALLLHSFDKLWQVFDGELDAETGRMEFLNQLSGVAQLLLALLACHMAVLSRYLV